MDPEISTLDFARPSSTPIELASQVLPTLSRGHQRASPRLLNPRLRRPPGRRLRHRRTLQPVLPVFTQTRICPHCLSPIDSAQTALTAELIDQIVALRRSLSELTERERALTQSPNAPPYLQHLVGLLVHHGIELRPTALTRALLAAATTEDEARVALGTRDAISRAIFRIGEARRSHILQSHLDRFDSFRTIFGTRENLVAYQEYLTDVFGQSPLRRLSPTMAFFANKQFSFSRKELVAVHVDGKFTSSVQGWKQTFELVCVLEREDRRVSFTFAFALLRSCRQECYEEFFLSAQQHGLPTPPILVSDFEVAVMNAATKVYPGTVLRGCTFHYSNNLLTRQSLLNRWVSPKVSFATLNFLRALPFIKNPHSALLRVLERPSCRGEALFRLGDTKLLLFVFSTYFRKLRGSFLIDLTKSITRTNNACEGRNSVLAQTFATAPSLREIVAFVATKFKVDLIRNGGEPKKTTDSDRFLLEFQMLSSKNLSLILDFVTTAAPFTSANAPANHQILKSLSFANKEHISKKSEAEAEEKLRRYLEDFNVYRKKGKLAKMTIKQIFIARQLGVEGSFEGRGEGGEDRGAVRGAVEEFDALELSEDEEKMEEGEGKTRESLASKLSRIQELLDSRVLRGNSSLSERARGALLELQMDLEEQVGTEQAEEDEDDSEGAP